MILTGRVWKYGDNVNTDVIFPGKYTYTITDPSEQAKHALEDLDPSFAKGVQRGDIIVGGKNWGNGSSREQAVGALKHAGVTAIIAKSFARIYFRNAVNNVIMSGLYGGILAAFILLLFLRSLRSTLIIAVAIPVSIVTSFILIERAGMTLNTMSLGGLALGIGMLVDNSIVVLENVYRHRAMGKSSKEAAIDGASEMAAAIVASTLNTRSSEARMNAPATRPVMNG